MVQIILMHAKAQRSKGAKIFGLPARNINQANLKISFNHGSDIIDARKNAKEQRRKDFWFACNEYQSC